MSMQFVVKLQEIEARVHGLECRLSDALATIAALQLAIAQPVVIASANPKRPPGRPRKVIDGGPRQTTAGD